MTELNDPTENEQTTRKLSSRWRPTMLIASVSAIWLALIGGLAWWFRPDPLPPAATVRFEFRLAETAAATGLTKAVVASTGDTIYLHATPVVTNSDVVRAEVGPYYDDFCVELKFGTAGGHRMSQATRRHMGRPIAILYDGQVQSAPIVRSQIGNAAIIQGNFAQAEAERIAAGIMAGR